MEIKLRLGGILFGFHSERPRDIEPMLEPFIVEEPEPPDITVELSWDWDGARLPQTPMAGEDALLEYYIEEDVRFCLLKGGPNGYLSSTCYTPDFQQMLCTIDVPRFPCPPPLGRTLHMLPMREIFQHFDVLFFHASQILYRGKGILFAAPSGTGKTTQAKLWRRHRGAEIICNDRTLTRKSAGIWRTYGYPLDGSEPVRSTAVNPLGAVVLLEQGPVNQVARLKPAKALPRLMRQMVLDCWSGQARAAALELLLKLMEDIPVFLLTCTPDERAVEALEAVLIENEVIPNGNNF